MNSDQRITSHHKYPSNYLLSQWRRIPRLAQFIFPFEEKKLITSTKILCMNWSEHKFCQESKSTRCTILTIISARNAHYDIISGLFWLTCFYSHRDLLFIASYHMQSNFPNFCPSCLIVFQIRDIIGNPSMGLSSLP